MPFPVILLSTIIFLTTSCAKSIRYPERGPDTVPVGVPETDQVNAGPVKSTLPQLVTTPVENSDATAMPIFKPERVMVWHIQGYTKGNSVFIGPHQVVLKIEPGRFLRSPAGGSALPVAAPLVEVGASRQSSTERTQGVVQAAPAAVGRAAASMSQLPRMPGMPENLPEAVRAQVEAILSRTEGN